ncbi:MAG: hypothetical protein ACR2KG_03970 [Nocardioidaceae bacterium]
MTPYSTENGTDLMASSVIPGKTSVVLNPAPREQSKRTYVIFGTERGGTSMVAGVARALGLPLGEIEEGNNEDKSFHNKSLGRMRATVDQRNAEMDVWGWKYPTAVTYLPVLSRTIRNPYFIIVYRDTVATALSRLQWDGEFIRRAPRMSLHETSSMASANTSFALATGRPCLLVSNEKGQVDSSSLIDELADFLCVTRPEDDMRNRILEYIEPGRYKKFDEYFRPSGIKGLAPLLPVPAMAPGAANSTNTENAELSTSSIREESDQ